MTELSALPGLPRLAKYELLEEIGHGGMATVYRARDKRLGREVAIKIIHKHLRENAEVGTRFIAEARAAAKLRHPCIVEVHDVSGDEDGERYLVVELCRGTTLRKILEQHRDMPAEVGASITLLLCDALEHAHTSGIIHRDVKPENVLVELPSDRKFLPPARSSAPGDSRDSPEPESARRPISKNRSETNDERPASRRNSNPSDLGVVIKLTDFGIAKMLDAQGVTSTGQVLGSPAHMAPEQIEAGEVDGRTDVFALGVLMYECLVGHLPFEGKNPAQVLRRVLEGTYPCADRERNTIGGRWSRIVDGALAHRLEDRTGSPAKLAKCIRDELEALGITDHRAEIEAYFANPESYKESLPGRLVPRLLARGEAARKSRDVVGAADDFNRALALAPNDPTIFKRVRGLQSSAARKRLLQRAAVIAGVAVVLGAAAFGIARARKSTLATVLPEQSADRDSQTPNAPTNPKQSPETATSDKSLSVVDPVDSAGPSPNVRLKFPAAMVSAAAAAAPAKNVARKVSFIITPPGAKLTLDGREEVWFSRVFNLRTGVHPASVRVVGSKCCEPFEGAITVEAPPENDPDQIQKVGIRLKPLPATVSLVGAPANSQLICAGVSLSVASGGSKTVDLGAASWDGRCQFVPLPPAEPMWKSVQIRAGEHNDIPWPKT